MIKRGRGEKGKEVGMGERDRERKERGVREEK